MKPTEEKARQEWARKVGMVFNTMPRDGYSGQSVWLPRDKMEAKFSAVLENGGVHICLDGPTGTGKTSLALTMLHKNQIKYTPIQITKSMDWPEFCKRLIIPGHNDESSVSADFEIGVDKWLPQAKFRVSLGAKGRPKDDLEHLITTAKSWSEHDVCLQMKKQNTVLFIDDFERASEDIVQRISDMCKLLTQSYQSQYAKIIIVGTDDICKKLYEANSSLESRLEEISLGTLPSSNESWYFLLLGFKALGLRNPADSNYIDERQKLKECIQSIYEAADGLPKSLNELGREISLKGYRREGITASDIINVSSEMPKRNLNVFRREFPKIIKCVEHSLTVRAILQYLYSEGIGHIHSWSDIIFQLQNDHSEDQLENAICELVDTRFLIKTGRNGDVLFAANPTLAHTLGVAVSNPGKYKLPPSLSVKEGQLAFSFSRKDDGQSPIDEID